MRTQIKDPENVTRQQNKVVAVKNGAYMVTSTQPQHFLHANYSSVFISLFTKLFRILHAENLCLKDYLQISNSQDVRYLLNQTYGITRNIGAKN